MFVEEIHVCFGLLCYSLKGCAPPKQLDLNMLLTIEMNGFRHKLSQFGNAVTVPNDVKVAKPYLKRKKNIKHL